MQYLLVLCGFCKAAYVSHRYCVKDGWYVTSCLIEYAEKQALLEIGCVDSYENLTPSDFLYSQYLRRHAHKSIDSIPTFGIHMSRMEHSGSYYRLCGMRPGRVSLRRAAYGEEVMKGYPLCLHSN